MQKELSDLELRVADLQKKLEESEQDKAALLKTVSHDIKAPFNQLFALSSLLEMTSENLSTEQVEYVSRMQMVVKEGLTLIRDLLDLRAIEYRRVQFREEEINIESVLQEVIGSFKAVAERKQVKIVSETQPVNTALDGLYVSRIFDHLLSNAIKFTPPGTTIQVIMTVIDKHFTVRVSDEGVGIPENELGRLFRKFAVLSPRPTAGESTIGLGLYLAKSIAEGLEGEVRYVKDADRCTFEVTLPVK